MDQNLRKMLWNTVLCDLWLFTFFFLIPSPKANKPPGMPLTQQTPLGSLKPREEAPPPQRPTRRRNPPLILQTVDSLLQEKQTDIEFPQLPNSSAEAGSLCSQLPCVCPTSVCWVYGWGQCSNLSSRNILSSWESTLAPFSLVREVLGLAEGQGEYEITSCALSPQLCCK